MQRLCFVCGNTVWDEYGISVISAKFKFYKILNKKRYGFPIMYIKNKS